jgi:DNA-directed RNA polymerase subunit RPC12/RpoP
VQKYVCPTCGRHLLESDAPAGYLIRLPSCPNCRRPKTLRTGDGHPAEAPRPGGRPDPLRYR